MASGPPVDKAPKEPPKVSQAYLTGKSSRPKAPPVKQKPAPVKYLGLVVAAAVLGGGYWAYAKITRVGESFSDWASLRPAASQNAEEVAGAVRARILANGGAPTEDAVEVTIVQAGEDITQQTVSVVARFKVLGLTQTLSGSFPGSGLNPSTYRGDGTPRTDGTAALKLQKVLATARCPEGTTQKGDAPPKGTETWCERPAEKKGKPIKHGPYFAWHPSGSPLEEGTYKDGKRDGKWTRFNLQGGRDAEAYYKSDIQHGRFRRWDASGTQIMDVEYKDGAPVSR